MPNIFEEYKISGSCIFLGLQYEIPSDPPPPPHVMYTLSTLRGHGDISYQVFSLLFIPYIYMCVEKELLLLNSSISRIWRETSST